MIDNALVEPGRQLEVTEALATMLGIDGTVELEWRFATTSEQRLARRCDRGRERPRFRDLPDRKPALAGFRSWDGDRMLRPCR